MRNAIPNGIEEDSHNNEDNIWNSNCLLHSEENITVELKKSAKKDITLNYGYIYKIK